MSNGSPNDHGRPNGSCKTKSKTDNETKKQQDPNKVEENLLHLQKFCDR